MYKDLPDRLKNEITYLINDPRAEIRVIASPESKYAVWKGASTLASMSTFSSSWVTAEDY